MPSTLPPTRGVRHRPCCRDVPRCSLRQGPPHPRPRSGTATRPPLPGQGRSRAPAGAGRGHEAAAHAIEACPAKPLALQQCEAVDRPLDWPAAPGQGDARWDGGVGLIQPGSETSEGCQRPGGRTLPPRSARRRLPRADQGGKMLGQVERLGDLGRLRVALGALPGLRCGALPRMSEPPARWRGAAWPRREALRLAHAAGLRGHRPLTARGAALLEGAQAPPRRRAARMPARQESRLRRVEPTGAVGPAAFTAKQPCGPEIARHGAGPASDLVGHRSARPALGGHGPARRIQRLPACLALGRALRRGCCNGGKWHGHSARPLKPRPGRRAQRRMDRVQGVRRCGKNLLQCFPAMLRQMQAGCALDGRGRTLARTLGLGGRPIAGAPCAPRRLLEPRGAGRGGALREERHGLAALQVHQDRARGLTLPQGESVHATPGRGACDGTGSWRRRRSRGCRLTARASGWLRRPPPCHPGPRRERRGAGRAAACAASKGRPLGGGVR